MATATRTKDAVLASAVDLARQVAVEIAVDPSDVGEHLGVVVEGERLVSHRFACLSRGYRGWEWTVTLARIPRSRTATVCEAELLPGPDAILGEPWVPWAERLRPGDIGPGDVLPFRADDPRLEPGWTPTGDPELDEVAIDELALARIRVLSPQGRDEAAERWYRGSRGPTSAGSLASAAACWSCGFMVPLQGALGTLFGVCANEWSPDDGRVVSLDHGCGAHSETDVEAGPSDWPSPDPLIDETRIELVAPGEPSAPADEPEASAGAAPADDDTAAPAAAATTDEAAADDTAPAADEAAAEDTAPGDADAADSASEASDEDVLATPDAATVAAELALETPAVAPDDAGSSDDVPAEVADVDDAPAADATTHADPGVPQPDAETTDPGQ